MPTTKNRGCYPMPPKEVLQKAYAKHLALKPCALEFGVSFETVRTWTRKYGIKINAHGADAKRQIKEKSEIVTTSWMEDGENIW